MNLGHIYVIKNTINDNLYVGQTVKFRKNKKKEFGYLGRFKEHIYASKNPTYHIDRMIKLLGSNNFSVELIEECNMNELDDKEIYYIKKINTLHPNGYNIVCGNPHKNSNPEEASKKLKEYYSNNENKKKHSEVHLNNFNKVSAKNLILVEIKPIKQYSIEKLVYIYFKYNDGKLIRRRYGGIHIEFEENYKRCLSDLKKIHIPNNECKVMDYIKNQNLSQVIKITNVGDIIKIELKLYKFKPNNMIALFLHNSTKNKKRIVFGGKTIEILDAFNRAIQFIKTNKINTDNIIIQKNLEATLPNCGELLKLQVPSN